MPPLFSALPVLAVLLLAMLGGCRAWPGHSFASSTVRPGADDDALAPIRERLAAGRWRMNPAWSPLAEFPSKAAADAASPVSRWQFDGRSAGDLIAELTDLAGRPDGRPADGPAPDPSTAVVEQAAEALAAEDPTVATAAAILWAQMDPREATSAADLLERVVVGDAPPGTVPPGLRAAAAEAWCRVLAVAPSDPLEALAPAGRALERDDLPVDARAELLIGVARHVAPAAIPELNAALDSAHPPESGRDPIRRAALLACIVHALGHRPHGPEPANDLSDAPAFDKSVWPDALLEWQREPHRALSDADHEVRNGFVLWLAATGDPRALGLARQQRLDADPRVRQGAITALGVLGTNEARDALLEEARRTSGAARARVVTALRLYDVDTIASFADDSAWQVQQAAAEALAAHPTPAAAAILMNLARARAPQVQAEALQSVRSWPDELAIPVLLAAMQDSVIVQRAAAFNALRRRKPIDVAFEHTEQDAGQRTAAIARLAREFGLPTYPGAARGESKVIVGPTAAADDSLIELTLAGLDDADVATRRRAAQRLADLARGRSLTASTIARVRDRLLRDDDVEVWRYAVEAVLPDATTESASIAALAAAHPATDIRMLACRYALRHRRPEFADWLQPLFEDPHRRVQLASIEAAGRCGNRVVLNDSGAAAEGAPLTAAARGLRSLVTDGNLRVRVAAAVAMCHLDDPAGVEELLRLSHTPEPGLRQEILAALAGMSHPRLVARLAEMQGSEMDR